MKETYSYKSLGYKELDPYSSTATNIYSSVGSKEILEVGLDTLAPQTHMLRKQPKEKLPVHEFTESTPIQLKPFNKPHRGGAFGATLKVKSQVQFRTEKGLRYDLPLK